MFVLFGPAPLSSPQLFARTAPNASGSTDLVITHEAFQVKMETADHLLLLM
jgi:hypothetical protein